VAMDRPRIVLVLSAALARLAHKYEDFAFRLAHLDAGCAVGQLRLVAGALAFDLHIARSWSDSELAARLRLDPDLEPVTGVVALEAQAPAADPARRVR
jgi:hypothetical protein